MAWQWSHSPEALLAARRNLSRMSRDRMAETLAEWTASVYDIIGGYDLDVDFYYKEYERLRKLPTDVLAAEIWARAEREATCDNGGHDAWMCPYGCGPHKVSFTLYAETR